MDKCVVIRTFHRPTCGGGPWASLGRSDRPVERERARPPIGIDLGCVVPDPAGPAGCAEIDERRGARSGRVGPGDLLRRDPRNGRSREVGCGPDLAPKLLAGQRLRPPPGGSDRCGRNGQILEGTLTGGSRSRTSSGAGGVRASSSASMGRSKSGGPVARAGVPPTRRWGPARGTAWGRRRSEPCSGSFGPPPSSRRSTPPARSRKFSPASIGSWTNGGTGARSNEGNARAGIRTKFGP